MSTSLADALVEIAFLRIQRDRMEEQLYRLTMGLPRFENVFCSQCGGEFGPGNNGFSHCEDHRRVA